MSKKKASHDYTKKALALHKKLGGKLRISVVKPMRTRTDLSLQYTPGVGNVASFVAKNPAAAREYTIKGKVIAVVSDGSAVLGLGNIGPLGALPVMEGKAALFKEFGGVDAVPIVLDTQDTEKIVETIIHIAPGFAGINLEDISAPRCFEIERRLIDTLDIPVMHDDQHASAIVALAATLNALKVVKKDLVKVRIVISGAGAAGTAIARLFHLAGARNMLVLDRKGIIDGTRQELHKRDLATFTNPERLTGGLREALTGADILIGVSGPNLATADDIRLMTENSIVIAMANPVPEIMPDEAKKGGAVIVATGRSDFPNQVNNSLVFPGIFRGAIDHHVHEITDDMKLKAAYALAALVPKPSANKIIPDMFDKRNAKAIAKVIR